MSNNPSKNPDMYRDLLRMFAVVTAHCDGMYDEDGETRMPVEDSDQITSAGTEVARLLGCTDAWNAISHALRAESDQLAGRLRAFDMLPESDDYAVRLVCGGHGTIYVDAAGDDAACSACKGDGYVYAEDEDES